jgi:hypothetical protein
MVRTQIQLTEEQARALKKIAQFRRLSVVELIRNAVDGLIKSSPEGDAQEKLKRATGIVGKFSSRTRDVSRKHDFYLEEPYGK